MFKRIASILLIFPAILIILAHTVIPHHHHDDRVCFKQHSCQVNHNSSHEHSFHEMACGISSHECAHHTATCGDCIQGPTASEQNNTCDYKRPVPCYHCHHDDDPDESESPGCCLLAKTIIFHPGPQRHELTCPSFTIKDHQSFQFIILAISNHDGHLTTPGVLLFRHKPFISPNNPGIAVHTPGLRAPPSC